MSLPISQNPLQTYLSTVELHKREESIPAIAIAQIPKEQPITTKEYVATQTDTLSDDDKMKALTQEEALECLKKLNLDFCAFTLFLAEGQFKQHGKLFLHWLSFQPENAIEWGLLKSTSRILTEHLYESVLRTRKIAVITNNDHVDVLIQVINRMHTMEKIRVEIDGLHINSLRKLNTLDKQRVSVTLKKGGKLSTDNRISNGIIFTISILGVFAALGYAWYLGFTQTTIFYKLLTDPMLWGFGITPIFYLGQIIIAWFVGVLLGIITTGVIQSYSMQRVNRYMQTHFEKGTK